MVTGGGAARRRLLPRGYGFAVAGIAVGMAGLVALAALADRISRFIDGGHRFVLGQISVAGAGLGTGAGFTAGGLLPWRTIEAIRRVPGVALVQAQVTLPLNPGTSELFSVNQELVLGVDLGVPGPNRNYPRLPIASGRDLAKDERGRVVVGAELAAGRGLRPGSRLRIGERDFEVTGVLERLLTAPDRFAIVPIEDARELWLALDPTLRALFGSGGPWRGRTSTPARRWAGPTEWSRMASRRGSARRWPASTSPHRARSRDSSRGPRRSSPG